MRGDAQRRMLLHLFHTALQRVEGGTAVRRSLAAEELTGRWHVVALGKAAAAMAKGALELLGEHADAALVITRHGYLGPRLPPFVETMEAGHPVPDESSLRAGERLVEFVESLPADASLLFLLSGGSSALVERLPQGVTLDDLCRVNQWLLASGLDIGAMNRVRTAISCIKGGRLARHLKGQRVLQLLISDVPGDDPSVIGSGPLLPSPGGGLPAGVPEWIERLAEQSLPSPSADDPSLSSIESRVIATNGEALRAVAEEAVGMGLTVVRAPAPLTGDAAAEGRRIAAEMRQGGAGLYLWGGETTVRLPTYPGRGGRCQQLALAAATEMAGEPLWLLAAGSDGADGPGEEAGALVDGETVARGVAEGESPLAVLAGADAGTFLEASGDLISTGPTGTNVMDIVLGWKGGLAG